MSAGLLPGRAVRWHHPEWGVAVVAAAAWVAVLGTHLGRGHDHGRAVPTIGGWALMATAMMLPSVLPAARAVALTGRWRRRQRSLAVFVTAYLTVWVAVGALAVAALAVGMGAVVGIGAAGPDGDRVPSGWLLPAALLVAAGWELTAGKRRLLRRCHRTAGRPGGDLDCARAGLRHGAACVGACWALMAAMFLAGPDLVLMAVLTAVVVGEKVLAQGAWLGPQAAAVLGAAAVYAAVL